MTALLFLDIETLGIAPGSAVWEVAAQRWEGNHCAHTLSVFVQHDVDAIDANLPQSFRDDYATRYDPDKACTVEQLFAALHVMADGGAIVCGSNPAYDMTALEALAAERDIAFPPWHYHPIDVPVAVHGYLLGCGIYPAQPWRSDFLSQAVGVAPHDYVRHTALGDVRWCRAMWAAITAGGDR